VSSGADHYNHAETLLELASDVPAGDDDAVERENYLLQKAQVHATLALAAATEKATCFAHGTDAGGYGR
jgi:hypothetical protein